MRILAITTCTTGTVHTYIAKEGLENITEELGDPIKAGTQGSIGIEDKLTPERIRGADIILASADIRVNKERFKDELMVEIPINTVMKSPKGIINKIHEKPGK